MVTGLRLVCSGGHLLLRFSDFPAAVDARLDEIQFCSGCDASVHVSLEEETVGELLPELVVPFGGRAALLRELGLPVEMLGRCDVRLLEERVSSWKPESDRDRGYRSQLLRITSAGILRGIPTVTWS